MTTPLKARRRVRVLDVRGARTAVAGAALLAVSAAAGAQTIAITGGKVYPVSGPPMENATVLIRDGKIVSVGTGVAVPSDAQRIDASGKWVTPGLINSGTQLGLVEIGQVSDTRDMTARGRDNVAASFTAWDGFNPRSVLVAPAREDGITSAAIVPGGGLVSGQAAIVDLVDGTTNQMLRRAPIAMVAEVGASDQAGLGARGELIVRLRELLDDARSYSRRRAAYESRNTRDFSASRLDLDALVPVVEGRLPLLIQVDRASDIESALKLARDYNLKIMIGGGAEAWEVADQLAAAKVPVLTGAMNNIPNTFAALGTRQENPGILRRAGVAVAIIGNAGGGDEEAFNVRNLRFEAGNAVAYGMTWDDALRSVTLTPAELFGVADRVGSLQPGRDANVVVWSGDPFEFATRAEHVFVHGREFKEPSRQDMLIQRYKSLPPNYLRH